MKKRIVFILINLILIFIFSQCSLNTYNENLNSNKMIVHYIDVGQGDAILIQVNSKNLLIDSGPASSKDKLIKYLKSKKISKFDYIIATHPHEDHIGNMSYIIDNFKVSKFYAPRVTDNSRAFEMMVDSLNRRKLKINILKCNINSIDLGINTKVDVFSPISDSYENINNYSPIMKISYMDTSFLFTGDAESLVEEQVINARYDLKSDVLKIGHHGSTTSTTQNFFNEVSPFISVISVGNNNLYKHPSNKTLSTIKNSKVYRTDLNGNVVLISDGKSIK